MTRSLPAISPKAPARVPTPNTLPFTAIEVGLHVMSRLTGLAELRAELAQQDREGERSYQLQREQLHYDHICAMESQNQQTRQQRAKERACRRALNENRALQRQIDRTLADIDRQLASGQIDIEKAEALYSSARQRQEQYHQHNLELIERITS